MSIVFPSDKDMRTAQVQADITDPEGILGVLRSIKAEIKDLLEEGQVVVEFNKSREKRITKCTELSDQISEHLTDFLCHAETMETMIHEDQLSLLSTDRDIDQLQSVQERLNSMNKDEFLEVTDADIDNEQRLLGYVADELSSKIEELSKFRQRLTDANDGYKYEWDQFRNEVRQYNTGTTDLETTVDHLHELHLARFAGEVTGTDDSELLFRFVEHHFNQISHRKLRRQLSDLQMKQKDLEDEIGTLITQKQSLWKQCHDLENNLKENTETSEENNPVRPTAAFSNLLEVIDSKFHPSMTHDLEQVEEEEKHGLYLHKCTTDINVIPDDFSEDEPSNKEDDQEQENIYLNDNPSTSKESYTIYDQSRDYLSHNHMSALGSQPPLFSKDILGHLEESPAVVTKLRMRHNTGGRISMSQRVKSSNRITTTGSIKNFMFKKRRASHD